MRKSFAQRQADKGRKAEQLKAKARQTENRAKLEAGKEIRNKRRSALYRVLERDSEEQDRIIRVVDAILADGRDLRKCEKVLWPRGWDSVSTESDATLAEAAE